jgi:hypothetical protein
MRQQAPAIMHTGPDVDLSPLGREFQSVAQRILEDLLYVLLVGAGHSQSRITRCHRITSGGTNARKKAG